MQNFGLGAVNGPVRDFLREVLALSMRHDVDETTSVIVRIGLREDASLYCYTNRFEPGAFEEDLARIVSRYMPYPNDPDAHHELPAEIPLAELRKSFSAREILALRESMEIG